MDTTRDGVGAQEVWYVGRHQAVKSLKNKQEELKNDLVVHWEPVQGGQDGSDGSSFPGSSRSGSSDLNE